ncbi:hypothetical protein H4R19_004384 [Coemansia spiralis]|nr:hypothetical protein H4R19_004384 [Coemansia spiralis]
MLYDRNQQTLFCSRGYTPSAFKTTCNMPYGSVYGVASSSMAIAALYSHTVAYGGNACGGGQEYHYYTVLTNYLKYVRSVLGRTPMEFVEDTDGLSSVRRIISYYMGSSTAPNADGTTMFGGNMVALQGGVQQVPQQDAGQPSPGQSSTVGVGNAIQTSQPYNSTSGVGPTPTPTPTSPSPSLQRPPANHNNGAVGDPADSNNSYDNSAANGDLQNTGIATRPHVSVDFEATGTDALSGEPAHYSGLSQKATIAIAVSVPIGTILIAAIVFFLVRHYRRNKAAGWRGGSGSGKRKSNVHSIIEQLGGAAREERLPTYEDLHDADMRDLNLPSPRTLPDY